MATQKKYVPAWDEYVGENLVAHPASYIDVEMPANIPQYAANAQVDASAADWMRQSPQFAELYSLAKSGGRVQRFNLKDENGNPIPGQTKPTVIDLFGDGRFGAEDVPGYPNIVKVKTYNAQAGGFLDTYLGFDEKTGYTYPIQNIGQQVKYQTPANGTFLSQLSDTVKQFAPLAAAVFGGGMGLEAAGFGAGAAGAGAAGAGAGAAGVAAADLAAADAIAGLTAGGAGAGTAAGAAGAGALAANAGAGTAATSAAGETLAGAGTNALAAGTGTAAGTNALAAGTAANSAAGETLAGVAGTGAGTSAAGETLAGTAGRGATGTTAAVADPYALQTAGGALTNSAGAATNPYTAPLATAAAAGTASWMTPAAIVGSSLIGANAVQQAANTQANAANQANQLLAQQYAQQRADLAPFTAAGVGAQNQLLTYLGLPGGTQGADYGKYTKDFTGADLLAGQDPGYAFRLSEGQKALERSAAARGGLLSGGTGKALTSYGQQMGSQEYQNAYNRYQTNRANQLAPLFTLTGSGQASAAGQAAAAGNYGTGAANNLTSAGAAQAAGNVGTANALTGGLNTYLGYTSQQDLLNAYNARTAAGRSSYGA